jgi:regulator of Ty1 transposition protein 103
MSYSDSALEKKLSDLNNSQQSIQQLSLWLIHHRKHSDSIIKIWYKEMIKSQPAKKLTYLYLANDVIQNSRKKCPELAKQFAPSVRKVVEHLAHIKLEANTVKSIGRLITIWQERSIFDDKTLADMRKFWAKKQPDLDAPAEAEPGTPPMKKIKSGSQIDGNN